MFSRSALTAAVAVIDDPSIVVSIAYIENDMRSFRWPFRTFMTRKPKQSTPRWFIVDRMPSTERCGSFFPRRTLPCRSELASGSNRWDHKFILKDEGQPHTFNWSAGLLKHQAINCCRYIVSCCSCDRASSNEAASSQSLGLAPESGRSGTGGARPSRIASFRPAHTHPLANVRFTDVDGTVRLALAWQHPSIKHRDHPWRLIVWKFMRASSESGVSHHNCNQRLPVTELKTQRRIDMMRR